MKNWKKLLKSGISFLLAVAMIVNTGMPVFAETTEPAETQKTGLLAYYDFEDASGTEVPNVADEENYKGALNGSAAISDEEGTNIFGKSLKLSGGGMQLTNIVNASTSSFSVSMWYKASSTSSNNVNLVQAGTIGGGTGRTILILDPNAKYQTYVTGDNAKTPTSTAVSPTEWQHITFAYDKDNSKAYFYVNGTADRGDGLALSGTALNTADMIIGRHRNNEGAFNGLIDEVRVYNTVLSADEAKEVYEDGAKVFKLQILTGKITEAQAVIAAGNKVESAETALANAIAAAQAVTKDKTYAEITAAITALEAAVTEYNNAADAEETPTPNPGGDEDTQETGLLAYYDFEGASDTEVPNVADEENYKGALNGSAAINDEEGTNAFGKSLKLSGGGMQLTNIVNASESSFSVSMWYKASGTSGSNVNLVQAGTIGGSTGRTILILDPNAKYQTYVTGDNAKTPTSTAISPTEWQHITFAYDKDNSKAYFYVNGTADRGDGLALSGTALNTADMIIGRHRNNEGAFNGLIDEVRIYNTVLSADEASAVYEDGAKVLKLHILAEKITAAEEISIDNELPEGKALTDEIAAAKEITDTSTYEEITAAIADLTEALNNYKKVAGAIPVEYTVNPKDVQRVVDDSIFGINHRYAFNGYGTFDSENKKVKDDFQKLYEDAGFGSIRYPGGTISNLFNWKTTLELVGRKNQIHGFYNNPNQHGIAPNFGIKEIADFADGVNSEIVYVYSLGRGNAQDAADLIEFLNAPVGLNPSGGEIDWAEIRSKSGHPDPYNVRYFEIGNEMQQAWAGSDGTASQGYWLTSVPSGSETAYIDGGTATFTKQYAVCEEDWNVQTSKSDGSANMVRYMRYANTNPKTYDENEKIVDDSTFVAVNEGVEVFVGNEQWRVVTNFEESTAEDKHVVVDYSTGALIFGNGEKGAIPAAGEQIYVSYSVDREGFVDVSKAMKETTAKINEYNEEQGIEVRHEAHVYSSYETSGFISKMSSGGHDEWYDGLTIHPYSGTPDGNGETFYDSAMLRAENVGVRNVQNYVDMMPEGKVPVISEYGIYNSTNSLVRSQTHAVYIAKVLMEYVRLGSPYIQKHCLVDWYSSGGDSLGPTQQAVIQAVPGTDANTVTGEGTFTFFSTPSAHVFQMLNSSFGTDILGGDFDTAEATLDNGVKAYSALSSKDENENYYVAFVNVDREDARNLKIKVDGKNLVGKDVEIQMLSTDNFADQNSPAEPDKVKVVKENITNTEDCVSVIVPKHSFAVVKIAVGIDKTELQTVIAAATEKEAEKDTYTAESWADLEEALAEAERVEALESVTQKELDKAAEALNEAIDNLRGINDPVLQRISVAAAPKTAYTTGERFDAAGLVLNLIFDVEEANTTVAYDAAVNGSKFTFDPAGALTTDHTKVTITYAGFTAEVEITVTDPTDASRDIPVSALSVKAGDYQDGEGPELVLDGNPQTHWHTNWYGTSRDNHYITFTVNEEYIVDGLRYQPRQTGGTNGIITKYEIQVSNDGTNFTKVAEGSWNADGTWKGTFFEEQQVKYVRLVSKEAISQNPGYVFASAAEIRLTGTKVEEESVITRLYGGNRFATGFAAAEEYKKLLGVEQFEAVVVATGYSPADALSGSYLAVQNEAPILLADPNNVDTLVDYVKANLVKDGKVYILGGTGAVPADVEEKLADHTEDICRLKGSDRFGTNLEILAEAEIEGAAELLVATGWNYADSLSASAVNKPILLVEKVLTDGQKEVLEALGEGAKIYILGGDAAVSTDVEAELKAYGTVERVKGADRFGTSVEIAKKFFGEDVEAVTFAYGWNYPDGLCGGPVAAAANAPVLLVHEGATEAAAEYAAGVEAGYIFGGSGAVADETVKAVLGENIRITGEKYE